MNNVRRPSVTRITTDQWLGAIGCSLAVGAASFGLYMTVHGPTSVASSGEFTIFAQLAPHENGIRRTHGPSTSSDALDTTATASIRRPQSLVDQDGAQAAASAPLANDRILPGITLRAIDRDAAEVAMDGRTRRVKVGDEIPGAGQVLAIVSGVEPMLRTSSGLIVP